MLDRLLGNPEVDHRGAHARRRARGRTRRRRATFATPADAGAAAAARAARRQLRQPSFGTGDGDGGRRRAGAGARGDRRAAAARAVGRRRLHRRASCPRAASPRWPPNLGALPLGFAQFQADEDRRPRPPAPDHVGRPGLRLRARGDAARSGGHGLGGDERQARATSSGPAPGRCASSDRRRRQARAPGRPWKAPSMCRVIALSGVPAAALGLDVGQHRRDRRLGASRRGRRRRRSAGRPRRGAPARDRRRDRSSRRRALREEAARPPRAPAMPPLMAMARSGKRAFMPEHERVVERRDLAVLLRAQALRARPCGHGRRSARTPAAAHRREEGRQHDLRILLVDADAALDRHRHGRPRPSSPRRSRRPARAPHQAGAEAARLHPVGRAADVEVDLVVAERRARSPPPPRARRAPTPPSCSATGCSAGSKPSSRSRSPCRTRAGGDHLGIEQRAPREARGGRSGSAGRSSPSSARRTADGRYVEVG